MPLFRHWVAMRSISSTNFWPMTVGSRCGRSTFSGRVTPAAANSFFASATLSSYSSLRLELSVLAELPRRAAVEEGLVGLAFAVRH